jgi:prolyl oligopeptidase
MPTDVGYPQGITETIHGHVIADPYRWLEDRSSSDTEDWIAEQKRRFEEYFTQFGSLDRLRDRVRRTVDLETIDQIGEVQNRLFYRKRGIGEQQASIFVIDSADGLATCLVNPVNQGPYASVGIHSVSSDGSLLAFEQKQGGEHSKSIFTVDVKSKTILPDHLERGIARGFVLSNTNDGFYYCHEHLSDPRVSEKDHAIGFHRFGTRNDDDLVLLTLPRTRTSRLVLKAGGEMLGATFCHELEGNALVDFYAARHGQGSSWRCIRKNIPAPFGPFFYRDRLFAHRFENTSNGEIVELNPDNGVPFRVIVPEWRARIQQCVIARDRLYLNYIVGTTAVVRVHSLNGNFLEMLPLENDHTWCLYPGHSSEVEKVFLECQSFVKPRSLFSYQRAIPELCPWADRPVPPVLASTVSRKMTYLSSDGIEVDISIVGRGNPLLLKNRPLIMTAYGGFGLTLTPQFSSFVSIMLEVGFLFAMPEIRGGEERGRPWHEAARRRNRQVAFNDFISAGDWLCEKGFTNPQKLAIFGGSNSGLLVGAAITQRPDLFRAALCIAPLLDMVRYHLFDLAGVWADEYGTADDPDDLSALLAYSPYHCVREETDYPAVMFVCGDRDTRCNPAHARKMTARLQHRPSQNRSILLDHSEERGHAPALPLSVRIEALLHRIAFLCHELGVPMHPEVNI